MIDYIAVIESAPLIVYVSVFVCIAAAAQGRLKYLSAFKPMNLLVAEVAYRFVVFDT